MSIEKIVAHFRCDGCNEAFLEEMDPARSTCRELPTTYELAEDAIRGNGFQTIQDGMHLCPKCTKVADNIHEDENKQPTSDEIKKALGAIGGL